MSGIESNKVRALLAFLVVEADRSHSREELAGLLWPDQPEQVARTNLRQALANLRQVIGDELAEPAYLNITRDSIQFNTASDYALDMAEFNACLRKNASHPHRHAETCRTCAARLGRAAGLYGGNFLEHFYINDSQAFDEWALVSATLHHAALAAFYQLADYQARQGDWEQAYRYAALQLQFDPWREEAHRQVMRAQSALGQRSAAINQYKACQRVLMDEFGVEPAEETQALYEQIRQVGPGIESVQNKSARCAPSMALIGREKELADINEILEQPTCRLVTLMGPGGIGKTCLARQLLFEQAGSFRNGASFVSLYPLSSTEELIPVIAETVGFSLASREDPKAQLIQHLREKEILIVLDNFEQLISGQAAGLLVEILQNAPGVVFLVTSRERLNLQLEWAFDLQGLSYPGPEDRSAPADYSAVRLFVQRAEQSKRSFSMTPQDAQAVARICSLVEGMPLAIELAAAAVRTRSCPAIALEIERNLHSLGTTMQDVPERHRSFRAVFEHSWCLLTEEEQAALRRLSAFHGGFSEEAAADLPDIAPAQLWALLDKSLLRQDAQGRYDMHELIAYDARRKLRDAGEADAIQAQHAAYFLKLAQQADVHLRGDQQQACLELLEREHNNLRAAMGWCIDQGNFDLAARLAGALWFFWWMHGYLSEGRRWLSKVLVDAQGNPALLSPAVRAKVLKGAGDLAYQQGDYAESLSLLSGCLKLQENGGDPREVANILNSLGLVKLEQGDDQQAKNYFEQGLAMYRSLGSDEPGIERLLNNLGNLAFDQADYTTSSLMHEESLALSRKKGDLNGTALALTNLGWSALLLSDPVRAKQCCTEALVLAQQLGNRPVIVFDLEALAGAAGAQACPVRSARLFGAAQALREAIQFPMAVSNESYYERILSITRTQLSQAAYQDAWDAGESMTMEQAILEALAE